MRKVINRVTERNSGRYRDREEEWEMDKKGGTNGWRKGGRKRERGR